MALVQFIRLIYVPEYLVVFHFISDYLADLMEKGNMGFTILSLLGSLGGSS